MERKGFGIRLGAFLIDLVIVIVISGVIGLILGAGFVVSYGGGMRSDGTITPEQARAMGLAGLVGGLLSLAYWSTDVFMLGTPGKKLLGLTIMSETGAPAQPSQLWARFATKNVAGLIQLAALIPGLGFLGLVGGLAGLVIFIGCFFALGAKRQALHDTLSKTAVFGRGVSVQQGFQPVMPGQPYAPPPGNPPPAV